MKTVSRADLRGIVKAEPDSHDNGYDACGSGDAATVGSAATSSRALTLTLTLT